MADDWDKLNSDGEFSLEEILAEYGSQRRKSEEGGTRPIPAEPTGPDLPWPDPKPSPRREGRVQPFPKGREPLPPVEDPAEEAGPEEGKVIPFPTGEGKEAEADGPSPVEEVLDHLRQKADAYAQQMFEEEGEEVSEETRRMEALIPGVDEEEAPPPRRERKPRPAPEPKPDLPPGELARTYGKGLKGLGLRTFGALLTVLPILYLAAAPVFSLPLPPPLAEEPLIQVYLSAGLLALAMFLGVDILSAGLARIFQLRLGMDTLTALSCIATLADALTMAHIPQRTGLPYCGVAGLGLVMAMWGAARKRRGQRASCRTAASAAEPYLVTLDEGKWNGRDTYSKWPAPTHGFGRQIQGDDGAQRIFQVAVPLLLAACILFSLIASVGRGRPQLFCWALSATLTASASFSGMLCFSLPWSALSLRLSKSGAALAGWEGVRWSRKGNGILLTDGDLFPPGTVSMNGIKVFGDFSVEKVVAVTATLIREARSGLDKIFHDLLRTQGAIYRRCSGFCYYEGGGMSAEIRGEQVLVGTASFMTLMEVALPPGLNVKNAVFCAIDGELAGIFALHYTLHSSISSALSALIHNKVKPVLATRDFNILPAMLRQKFKLPVDRMEFPGIQRRVELSDAEMEHGEILTAVLCREGLSPLADAVVGARRLRIGVRLSAALSVAGSVVGVLLTFYLTSVAAFSSLTTYHLALFMLLWLVPTLLISNWVNRY